ncbi:MAG: thiamine ABC transporter substrate-binding protein [Acidimicrobiales bacterium]|nr:thiamine ABC transporter substrate-binding protein [Acidimicrobiales bacterium]
MAVLGAALLLATCGGDATTATTGATSATSDGTTLTLMTHDSFAVSEDVLAGFEARTGISVDLLPAGDAGSVLSQAILTADDPLADVLFGVDTTFLTRALDADLFVPYRSAALDGVPTELQLDPGHRVTPVDYGDVCVNVDLEWFAGRGLDPPPTLDDLADPAYRGLLVVQDPATSSPGLAFLLATVARYGWGDDGPGWQAFWEGLRANDVLVVSGWEEAYYGEFSGGSGEGSRPLVVSYATSPVAEVVFSDPQPAEPPTGVLTDTCFRQVEMAGILRGTEHEDAARALIDFLLSPAFQQDVPLQMFVYPARSDAALPDVFTAFATPVADPLTMDPAAIGEQREELLDEWRRVIAA